MNTKVLDFRANNLICEAAGCFASATERIEVRAGSQKAISLLLCSDCISKFQETTQK